MSETQNALWQATKTQGRVIFAVFLRDLLNQVGRSPVGAALTVLRPAAMVAVTALLYAGSKHTIQGMSLLAFLVTGWLPYFAFIRTFRSFQSRRNSLLLFPQVTMLDVAVSNLLVEWLIYTLVFILFIFGVVLIERSPFPADPLRVVLAFWNVELMGCLLGIVLSSIARVVPVVSQLTAILRRGIVLVSGVAIAAADTPLRILDYLSWSPMFQSLEMMREAWWPAYVSPITNPSYLMLFMFFFFAFALAIERVTRRFAE